MSRASTLMSHCCSGPERLGWVLLAALLAVSGVSSVGAAERETAAGKVFVRFSAADFDQFRDQPFDQDEEMRDLILGTDIHGHSKTEGKYTLLPLPEDAKGEGAFRLKIEGASVTKSKGYNGPVIIHSTTTTEFTALSTIQYDVRKGFYAEPLEIDAKTEIETTDIDCKKAGPFGAALKRVAQKRIEAAQEEANAIALEKAKARIEKAVTVELERQLARFNENYQDLNRLVRRLDPQVTKKAGFCLTGNALLMVLGPETAGQAAAAPVSLPPLASRCELWVDQSLVSSALSEQLGLQTTAVDPEAARRAAAARTRPQVKTHASWLVVQVGRTSPMLKSEKPGETVAQ